MMCTASSPVLDLPRFFKLTCKQLEVKFPVSDSVWFTLDQLSKDFSVLEEEEISSELELCQLFLQFLVNFPDTNSCFLDSLKEVYEQFLLLFDPNSRGFYSALSELDAHNRLKVLNTCNKVYQVLLENNYISKTDRIPHLYASSTFFESLSRGESTLFSVFGGQGVQGLIEELRQVYTYYPVTRSFIEDMCHVLLACSRQPEVEPLGFFSRGMDVFKWLTDPLSLPSEDYLTTCFVSAPLIALVQLANYYLFIKLLNISPGEMLKHTLGLTGHSQGLASAVAVGSSATLEDFHTNSFRVLKLLFWIGFRGRQVYPPPKTPPASLGSALQHLSEPTPMLAIMNLPVADVERRLREINAHLPETHRIYLSLINGPMSVVLSGHPQLLHGFLASIEELLTVDESGFHRMPFSQRRAKVTAKYLPCQLPFHSPYVLPAVRLVDQDIEREGLHWPSSLLLPVYSTEDGTDLRGSADLSKELVRLISVCPVNWPKATSVTATHIFDFGPGGLAGIGAIISRRKYGDGACVVIMSAESSINSEFLSRKDIFSLRQLPLPVNWKQEYAPKLVKLENGGVHHLHTKMSQLLGKPPIMVAGMTPTTVNAQFVAACTDAGYHVELAGGGHLSRESLKTEIEEVLESTPHGTMVTVNILYLNIKQWSFQFPLVLQMKRENYPIEGICIAAGVPSPENASEILEQCQKVGLRHVAFKPGTASSIRQVVNIALAHPEMPIMLQWTGGRGGGHHSFEDFHQPILITYKEIRKAKNVVLVAGSGFGDATGSYPYLTGDWSKRYECPPMPFDGVLLASRVMVAKEAKTSAAVKEYLAYKCEGLDSAVESDWEKSYKEVVGGITTVLSELGEPIHKVATRAVLLWKELDDTVFALPKKDQLKILLDKKEYVISRLNKDGHKVYFGKKKDGSVVDVDQMTYSEVILRLLELLYVPSKQRWIHPSYVSIVVDMICRTANRLGGHVDTAQVLALLKRNEYNESILLQNVLGLLANIPLADVQLINPQDVDFFLALVKRRGQKPVPFIPVIDEDFKFHYKKDSLWQSENLECVFGEDVERVCILQGPVAARYSRVPDQPVKEILDEIYQGLIALAAQSKSSYKSSVVQLLGGTPIAKPPLQPINRTFNTSRGADFISFTFPARSTEDLPLVEWLNFLALEINSWSGAAHTWLSVLLLNPDIVRQTRRIPNYVAELFAPRPELTVIIKFAGNALPKSVELFDGQLGAAWREKSAPVFTVVYDENEEVMHVVFNELCECYGPLIGSPAKRSSSLKLHFKYAPVCGNAVLHEIVAGKNARIADFYSMLWLGRPLSAVREIYKADLSEDYFASKVMCTYQITQEKIDAFVRATGALPEATSAAPIDFGFVVAWEAYTLALLSLDIDADLTHMLHLSDFFKRETVLPALVAGDTIETTAEIYKVQQGIHGDITLDISALLRSQHRNKIVLQLRSEFMYRGTAVSAHSRLPSFEKKNGPVYEVQLISKEAAAVLAAKPWAHWADGYEVQAGDVLVFELSTVQRGEGNKRSYETTGTVTLKTFMHPTKLVGHVVYKEENVMVNAVFGYLSRHGRNCEEEVALAGGEYSLLDNSSPLANLVAPVDCRGYALASGDTNPIHVNPYLASLSDLSGLIVHGHWTSTACRHVIEMIVANGQASRIVSYDVQFLGMVLPGDQLKVKLTHVAMANGHMVIRLEAANQNGVLVLRGAAGVEQPTTAFVFTGQGAQRKGMGMDLYEKSPHAKKVWDAADRYFRDHYGFSIIDIVRKDPKTYRVHFGGTKGNRIRALYMSLTCDSYDDDGHLKTLPLFPSITEHTPLYTFTHPMGLLSATQFTQPAMVLYELAAFEDMKAHGLVPTDAFFAGHSLGEFAALAAFGNFFPYDSLMDVVFYRGMTMRSSVKRDSDGFSKFGMLAVNPSLVGSFFNKNRLSYVCGIISEASGFLLDIVNHNVENWQYVVAGHTAALATLTNVLNHLKRNCLCVAEVPTDSLLHELVATHLTAIRSLPGRTPLERGVATIPLAGLDVPFHSRFLLNGVGSFRSCLKLHLREEVNFDLLLGRYVPNLVALPFELTTSFLEAVNTSPVLKATGNNPELATARALMQSGRMSTADRQRVGYCMLVELLAYQFASPVQWIKTQDFFFGVKNIERFIEVGPDPVLSGMARRTINLKYVEGDKVALRKRAVLSVEKDAHLIYYNFAPAPTDEGIATEKMDPPLPTKKPSLPLQPAPPISSPALPLALSTLLKTLVAAKIKRRPEDIDMSSSIKSLSGGNSTVQNEILGDLSAELSLSTPIEGLEDIPLSELDTRLAGSFSGTFGKILKNRVSRLFSLKFPAGLSVQKMYDYLSVEYGLRESCADNLVVQILWSEPSARLKDDTAAYQLIDDCALKLGLRKRVVLEGQAPTTVLGTPSSFVSPLEAASIPDSEVSPLECIRTLVALKLRKKLNEVSPSSTIQMMSGGRSALQNELLSDIEAEFGRSFRDSSDLESVPLAILAKSVENYKPFGRKLKLLFERLFTSKFPAGHNMSSTRALLSEKYGFGPGMTNQLLLFALTLEPTERLVTSLDVANWLDATVKTYSSVYNVTIPVAPFAPHIAPADLRTPNGYREDAKSHRAIWEDHMAAIQRFFGRTGREHYKIINTLQEELNKLADERAALDMEHGRAYIEGIQGLFSKEKIRRYDSYWNWARQEFYELQNECVRLSKAIPPESSLNIQEKNASILLVWNKISRCRLTPALLKDLARFLKTNAGQWFCQHVLSQDPSLVLQQAAASAKQPVLKVAVTSLKPQTLFNYKGKPVYSEAPRSLDFCDEIRLPFNSGGFLCASEEAAPLLNLQEQGPCGWRYDKDLTSAAFTSMTSLNSYGLCLRDKVVLVTGCGKGSIGDALLDALLEAGGNVIVTTSSYSQPTTDRFRHKYERHGGQGSSLTLLPFNQASLQDVKSLVAFIYDELDADPDFVFPFAAIPEYGRSIDNIDDKSELAHRVMLTNTLRLLGEIKIKKCQRGMDSHPSTVFLPLSPNHGIFGFDGLYSESKLGLESVLRKWRTEDWAQYFALVGACIGWTRGTTLTQSNNIVSEGVESLGARTFSTQEIVLSLLSLMNEDLVTRVSRSPVLADISGGILRVPDFDLKMKQIRRHIAEQSSILSALHREKEKEKNGVMTNTEELLETTTNRLANIKIEFPRLLDWESLQNEFATPNFTLDLDSVVVVTGYGEVGPWGSSRTRWDMEAFGEFSLEGCVEMAWMMGFIKYHNGLLEGKDYSGWVDTEKNTPVGDYEVKEKFEDRILSHAGIRLIEPELFEGYNPERKQFIQQIVIERELGPVDCSKEEAEQYLLEHGEKVDIFLNQEGSWSVVFKKGCQLYIPKALRFDRVVAGQIPTGWDARRYGVPSDLVDRFDPVTLYNLVSTVEALVCSGITDPYELYEYVHVSEVGNVTGSSVGGVKSSVRVYKERCMDPLSIQSDILQETFVNSLAAWVNMLLLSSSGPIKAPVGACATSVVSLEVGVETILTKKAKVVIVGGCDDFQESGSYEFAQMRASSSSTEEFKMGRTPREMSRPATSSRAGFMEAQGAGNQILVSASLAIKMGLPIYGIIAHVCTATDKEGRSLPAPGQGILTTAREITSPTSLEPMLLNFAYRQQQIQAQSAIIDKQLHEAIQKAKEVCKSDTLSYDLHVNELRSDSQRKLKALIRYYGHEFYHKDPRISPLKGALSVYNLTVDDIGVVSFHGTGTKANDLNESQILQTKMAHLGREPGHVCPGVFQKYLTGHPKAAAGSFMLNGILQILQYNIIPGNRNADNIDAAFENFDYILYPSRTLYPAHKIRAALLQCFGFGQVGGESLVIHPDYVLGSLSKEAYEAYRSKRNQREGRAYKYINDALALKIPFVPVKTEPPYDKKTEKAVYLNPLLRASYSKEKRTWIFTDDTSTVVEMPDTDLKIQHMTSLKVRQQLLESLAEGTQLFNDNRFNAALPRGVGLDIEPLTSLNIENAFFLERNFTAQEIAYCGSQPDPHSSFTGRWCAKEAVVKAVSNFDVQAKNIWQSAGAPLKQIEILPGPSGSPYVVCHEEAKRIVEQAGIKHLRVSISHSGEYAASIAVVE